LGLFVIAPVFLSSGVGALLAVLINRLSRIVDRARVLEGAVETLAAPGRGDQSKLWDWGSRGRMAPAS